MSFPYPFGLAWVQTSLLRPHCLSDSIVYCMADSAGTIVYVGITSQGEDRFPHHHRIERALNWYGAVSLYYIHVAREERRRAIEMLIRHVYRPQANREPLPTPDAVNKALWVLRPRNALAELPRKAVARNPVTNALLAADQRLGLFGTFPKEPEVPRLGLFGALLSTPTTPTKPGNVLAGQRRLRSNRNGY